MHSSKATMQYCSTPLLRNYISDRLDWTLSLYFTYVGLYISESRRVSVHCLCPDHSPALLLLVAGGFFFLTNLKPTMHLPKVYNELNIQILRRDRFS